MQDACRAINRPKLAGLVALAQFISVGALGEVLFESVYVKGGLLRFRHAAGLRDVVKDDLVLDYGPGVDLSKIPRSVLWAPGVFNMAPVVWFLGLTVTIPFRYRPMEQGLERIHAILKQIYPKESWNGRLVFEGEDVPVLEAAGGAIVMFSGGLDSIQTIYRHLEERPALVMLTPISMDPEIKVLMLERGEEFAAQHGLEHLGIDTNVKHFLRSERLLFPDLVQLGLTWLMGVQYGMGMPSTAAPLAYLKGAGRVYFASSRWEGEGLGPVGSMPAIDDQVVWPGARVIHDSIDLSRQQKVQALIRYTEGSVKPRLQVCNRPLNGMINCGTCEKCLRMIAGLLVEGEVPRDWGLDIDAPTAIERLQHAFERKTISILDDQLAIWSEIRERAGTSQRCPNELARYFAALDIEPHHLRSRRAEWRRSMVHKFAPKLVKVLVSRLLKTRRRRAHQRAVQRSD